MKNWEVRQAAINFGLDMGQMHVGSRTGLGPEQISRQALLDEMIRQGVRPEQIPGLAKPPKEGQIWPFTRPMGIPSRLTRVPTVSVLIHEAGHSIVSGMNGREQLGIASHLHPDLPQGAAAGAMMQFGDIRDAAGNIDPVKLANELQAELEIGAAGAAAEEVIMGIDRNQNPGLGGDKQDANQLMDAAGIPVDERQAQWDAAVDRAAAKLRPIANMIREEVSRREENLPVEWHFSKRRVQNIVLRAQRESLEAAGQQGLWDVGRVGAGAGPGAPQGAGIGQGPGAGITTPATAGPPLRGFRAPKITFDVMVMDNSGQLNHVTIKAIGQLDLQRQLIQQFPQGWRAAGIIGETGRKPPGPVAWPFKEGESPFKDMMSAEDVEGRARREERRALRASTIGRPVNPTLIAPRLSDGKLGYFGPLTPDQYIDKWQTQMPPQQIQRWRDWYPEVRKSFNTWFGDNMRKLGAWALSQKNSSPSTGMMNVQRTQDLVQGQPRVLREVRTKTGPETRPTTGGLAEDQIREMLMGETPSQGVAAKLSDFMDSLLGRLTRTWMGDNPKYGQPAAIDVHGGRGAGFIDQKLLNQIEEQYGPEAIKGLVTDVPGTRTTKLTEAQYSFASKNYNDLAEELNRRNFMGGGWDASQVQAVDWAATGMQIGRPMELPASIFDKNIRRIAFEVNPSPNSPLAKLAPWENLTPEGARLVTHDTAEHAIRLAMREAGGQIAHKVYGPGGWMDAFSPAGQLGVMSSPEASERAALVLGHLLGQEEVLVVRPRVKGGNGHVFEITEVDGNTLSEPNQVEKYWQEFRREYPQAEGFMPTRNQDGSVGISIARRNGHFNPAELLQLETAAKRAAARSGIKRIGWEESPAEVYSIANDWEHYPNGEQYLRRLAEIGKPGIIGRMQEYARAIQRTYIDAYRRAINRTREAGP